MNNRQFDKFITEVLNSLKDHAEQYREQVLNGQLDLEEYKYMTGALAGMDQGASILQEMARTKYKEMYEDDE